MPIAWCNGTITSGTILCSAICSIWPESLLNVFKLHLVSGTVWINLKRVNIKAAISTLAEMGNEYDSIFCLSFLKLNRNTAKNAIGMVMRLSAIILTFAHILYTPFSLCFLLQYEKVQITWSALSYKTTQGGNILNKNRHDWCT